MPAHALRSRGRLRIRPIRSVAEYHACEDLQQSVWRFTEREIIPINELLTIARHGGVVLGAFDGRGRMRGFVFGFPGLEDGRPVHCSRMLAVEPGFKDAGLGFRLKAAQRAAVLAQGIRRMTWTFDPLQSRNARFNLEKLGVTSRRYVVNLYGPSTSVFNRGLPTDRFVVDWDLDSARVRSRMRAGGKSGRSEEGPDPGDHAAIETARGPGGFRRIVRVRPSQGAGAVSVEIPWDIQALRAADPAGARRWRQATRRVFRALFRRGYVACGFRTAAAAGERRGFYRLEAGPG